MSQRLYKYFLRSNDMDVPHNEERNYFLKVSVLKVIETNSEAMPFAPHTVT